ncbi:MAG TPA: Asp-tRNA(Asn)/Glu-tRNA(Gln) amidotransferase subunit GatB [Candidatus Kapabacteria bacterium]|nr:Asp-tRNA(Asn)/Glu-tRNA(Gln) amidotransferase subunit GatB [Candidatus Kapabacteria bacterium]
MNPSLLQKYEPVIGLEVHAQMLTRSKAFCSCSTEFGALPNHNTCPICLGHPGTLPALNENLLRFIVRMGLATNCKIRERSIFARKNYFYPDLPKGYQISQYETPICHDGFLDVELPSPNPSREREGNNMKRIGITRIHMEEDAGKSIHDFGAETLVDLNRAGVPLIEIVSEPDMRSSDEAYAYLTTIKSIVTYLGICDGNMEEGSLRCDANVSVRLRGAEKFGQKTEVKNMNSFRNVQRALESEIERQIALVERGEPVIHQSMQFDASKGVTRPMRTKEEAHDYRYFPEPDLLPVTVSKKYLSEVQAEIPELQHARRDRFVAEYKLPKYDSDVLTVEKSVADFFEETTKHLSTKTEESIKSVSNYIMGDVMRLMTERKQNIIQLKLTAQHLSELVGLIQDKTISNKIAKDIFPDLLGSDASPKEIVEKRGLVQVTDTDALRQTVLEIIAKNQTQLAQYKSGKTALFGFFVGQVMKATQGKANPEMVNELMKEELEKI